MITIYKYPLPVRDFQTIEIGKNAQILSVCEQNNQIVLYAMVCTNEIATEDRSTVRRVIGIYGTGNPISEHPGFLKFIGTVSLDKGSLMFHVFEVTP